MTDDLYSHPRDIHKIINYGCFEDTDRIDSTEDLLSLADTKLERDPSNLLDYFDGLCVQLDDGRYVTLELSISFEELSEEEVELRK